MTSGHRRAPPSGRPPPTVTSTFGVGRRENHDSTAFYDRFGPVHLSDDVTVNTVGRDIAAVHCRDAREIAEVFPANSVALVVTSPPYFVGKEYEIAALATPGEGGAGDSPGSGVPARYQDYLQMLREVLAACVEVLEPGGRMAVNVANLGRKPYRSLSADVISILQDDLGLLLRGEIIWQKAQGANGSVAWGSYRDASNPVLRDVTERVVIAGKGRFARIPRRAARKREGLPHESTLSADEFMEATLDVWRIPPESARRVGHPAPFPVELPRRLIDLYTYTGDVVVDPFLGSGATLVAAERAGRRGFGFDLDPDYCEIARRRLQAEMLGSGSAVADEQPVGARRESDGHSARNPTLLSAVSEPAMPPMKPSPNTLQLPDTRCGLSEASQATDLPISDAPISSAPISSAPMSDAPISIPDSGADRGSGIRHQVSDTPGSRRRRDTQDPESAHDRAVSAGRKAADIVRDLLSGTGFAILDESARVAGARFDLRIRDAQGGHYLVDVAGGFTTVTPGLTRSDTLWKTLGRILMAQSGIGPTDPILVLTARLPKPAGENDKLLRSVGPDRIFDVIEIYDRAGHVRLRRYAQGVHAPSPGFWTHTEIHGSATSRLVF